MNNESCKMRRAYNPKVPDTRANDCLEATRRLYRAITDIAKRLDEQRSCALNVTDIFTPSGEVLRARLKDYCERLIFKDPVGHACKTEELLWRKGFYDAVSASKKLRKSNAWNETERALLSSHLAVGVGYYHHLILKLQLECDLDLSGVIDFAYPRHKNACLTDRKAKISQNKLTSDEVRQCAVKIIHRSLVCLGDLARYKLDLDPTWDPLIASRYYKIAVSIDPDVGMPHNQLGTMAGNRNHGLDAVYHYTRCILCAESFEGADGNLKRVIAAHSYSGKEKYPYQKCAGRLFSLLQLWDSETSDPERINQDCQDLLVELEKCLNASAAADNNEDTRSITEADDIETYLQNCRNEQTSDLTDDMIFKMVAICLMSIEKLKARESGEVQGAIAFALTILSQLVQIAVAHLQRVLVDVDDIAKSESPFLVNNESPELDAKNENDRAANGIVEEATRSSDEDRVDPNECTRTRRRPLDDGERVNGHVTSLRDKKLRDKSKNLLTKLRRPRKRFNSSDSEASDVDGTRVGSSSDEMNSDISETEEEEDDDDVLSDCNGVSDDPQSEDVTDDETPKSSNCNRGSPRANGHDPDAEKRRRSSDLGLSTTTVENGSQEVRQEEDFLEVDGDTTKTVSAVTTNGTSHDASTDVPSTLALTAQLRKRSFDAKAFLTILSHVGTLRSIKICFDWLRGNPEIFRMFAKSSGASLKRLVCLLNLVDLDDLDLPFAEWERDCALIACPEKLRDSTARVPLPEDIDLRGLKLLRESHEGLDWRRLRHTRMCVYEETLLRARKFVEFGKYVCSIGESGVMYEKEKGIFVTTDLKRVDETRIETRINNGTNKEETTEHSRGKLMRHMGRLWLKAEVRALESRLRSKLISPYLVPDHEALAKHTPALKRLVYAKKFIVIIPSVVVSALDEMKRTSSKAREATRWLEAQLRKGSRFLRAQRPHERLPLPLIKGPRSKDKEAWLFFQIIECCHYLTQQTKVGLNGDKEPPVVTLLTGFSAEERKAAVYSPDGLSKTAGVNLEHVESFHTKWKTSSKSHG